MRRAIVIILALAIDLALGDPPNRFHPVVLMGNWISSGRQLASEQRRFWFGITWIGTGAALFALPLWKIEGGRQQQPQQTTIASAGLRLVLQAVLLKPVFAYRNLRRRVAEVASALANGDLPEARRLASRHLVSRDTSQLSAPEVAGAAIESLAENVTDSLTAPLLAYTTGGLPAAWAYRFVNTADAMWGYRTGEYEQLGKFPARLDDILNWLPARLTGWLLVAAAFLADENGRHSAQVMVDQHRQTSSPNAGWTMSAMAGALEVTITKRGSYRLAGGASEPDVATIRRALRITDLCVSLSVVTLVVAAVILDSTRK